MTSFELYEQLFDTFLALLAQAEVEMQSLTLPDPKGRAIKEVSQCIDGSLDAAIQEFRKPPK